MRIGIIVAMDKELALLLPLMDSHEVENKMGCHFHTGRIGWHDIVAMECGIGKVNAAISTLLMLEEYKPDMVISTGVAGAADSSINVMDIVVADKISYHDVWCGPGTKYGQAAGMPIYFTSDAKISSLLPDNDNMRHGLLCSGDTFIDSIAKVQEIKSHFPEVLAVDMESAAIAHVCSKKEVPIFCMRVISDSPGAGHNNAKQYDDFWSEAPEHTFEIIKELLNRLKA